MSRGKPGPDRTVVYRYSQSFTDADVLRRVQELKAKWGVSMAKAVERILAEALESEAERAGSQQQLPLDNDMVAA